MPNRELRKMVLILFIVRHLLHMQVIMKLNREKTELFSVLCIVYNVYCIQCISVCIVMRAVQSDKVWFTNKVLQEGESARGEHKEQMGGGSLVEQLRQRSPGSKSDNSGQ